MTWSIRPIFGLLSPSLNSRFVYHGPQLQQEEGWSVMMLNSGSSTRLYGMHLTAALCNGAVRGQPVDSHEIICHTSVTCERHSHVCIYTT